MNAERQTFRDVARERGASGKRKMGKLKLSKERERSKLEGTLREKEQEKRAADAKAAAAAAAAATGEMDPGLKNAQSPEERVAAELELIEQQLRSELAEEEAIAGGSFRPTLPQRVTTCLAPSVTT
jgi:hypothetical protein